MFSILVVFPSSVLAVFTVPSAARATTKVLLIKYIRTIFFKCAVGLDFIGPIRTCCRRHPAETIVPSFFNPRILLFGARARITYN